MNRLCQLTLCFELQSTSEIRKGCIKIAIGQQGTGLPFYYFIADPKVDE